MRHSLHLY